MEPMSKNAVSRGLIDQLLLFRSLRRASLACLRPAMPAP